MTAEVRTFDTRKLGGAVMGPNGTYRDDQGAFVAYAPGLVKPFARPTPDVPGVSTLQTFAVADAEYGLCVAVWQLDAAGKPLGEPIDVLPVYADQPAGVRGVIVSGPIKVNVNVSSGGKPE